MSKTEATAAGRCEDCGVATTLVDENGDCAARYAMWERLGESFKADVRAAIDRVYAALPGDPGNASGVVEIAISDLFGTPV